MMFARRDSSSKSIHEQKPRVILIPDTISWILGTWALEIKKWNQDKYQFVIFPFGEIRENSDLFIKLLPHVDVVHCLSQTIFPAVKHIVSTSGTSHIKLISTIHHVVRFEQIEECIHADRIMVVCRQFLIELLSYRVQEEKIFLVYNGVDTDYFNPHEKNEAKQRFGIPTESFTIGFSAKATSDHDGRKGVDVFRDVLTDLASKDLDIHIILTGPGWHNLVRQLSSEHMHIHYYPYLPRRVMPAYYSALDMYLVTARVEGGPVPPLEAMSCGAAVVSTPVGTILDFVKDGCNGLLVPIEDKKATLDAVMRLYADRDLAKRLALAGRETIVQNLQWKSTVSRMDALYETKIPGNKELKRNDPRSRAIPLLNHVLIFRDNLRWQEKHGLQKKWSRIAEVLTRLMIVCYKKWCMPT